MRSVETNKGDRADGKGADCVESGATKWLNNCARDYVQMCEKFDAETVVPLVRTILSLIKAGRAPNQEEAALIDSGMSKINGFPGLTADDHRDEGGAASSKPKGFQSDLASIQERFAPDKTLDGLLKEINSLLLGRHNEDHYAPDMYAIFYEELNRIVSWVREDIDRTISGYAIDAFTRSTCGLNFETNPEQKRELLSAELLDPSRRLGALSSFNESIDNFSSLPRGTADLFANLLDVHLVRKDPPSSNEFQQRVDELWSVASDTAVATLWPKLSDSQKSFVVSVLPFLKRESLKDNLPVLIEGATVEHWSENDRQKSLVRLCKQARSVGGDALKALLANPDAIEARFKAQYQPKTEEFVKDLTAAHNIGTAAVNKYVDKLLGREAPAPASVSQQATPKVSPSSASEWLVSKCLDILEKQEMCGHADRNKVSKQLERVLGSADSKLTEGLNEVFKLNDRQCPIGPRSESYRLSANTANLKPWRKRCVIPNSGPLSSGPPQDCHS